MSNPDTPCKSIRILDRDVTTEQICAMADALLQLLHDVGADSKSAPTSLATAEARIAFEPFNFCEDGALSLMPISSAQAIVDNSQAKVAEQSAIPPLSNVTWEAWPPRPVGGQQVGLTHGVRGTHEDSGLSGYCGNERSQHRNRRIVEDMLLGGLTSPAYRGVISE